MSSTDSDRNVPVVVGAVAGAVAWILGYVCTYIITGTRIRESALAQVLDFLGEGAAAYKLVGWVFFNSHFVDIVFEGVPAGAANAVGGDDGFTALLFAVPPALLVAAGLAVGRYQGVETTEDGALAGLALAAGYFTLSVIGALIFVVTAGPASGRPDLMLAVVLAGVVYPVVFGAVGGAIAGATATE